MKQGKLIFTLLCISIFLVSCSKKEWGQTIEGYNFFSQTKANQTYSWTGGTFGNLIHGDGRLITYNKKGIIVSEIKCQALYGAPNIDFYVDSRYGKYLGKGKVKKGYVRPEKYGVLIINETYPDDPKALKRINMDDSWLQTHNKIYVGDFHKGRFSGYGRLYGNNLLEYEGYWKKGEKSSVGKEYKDGYLIYNGYFKRGQRSGPGDEFARNTETDSLYKKYTGEWKNGKYDGYGKIYNEHILIYEGYWKNGLYDGKGKLYANGECIDGKWEEGINAKIYNKTLINQVLTYFGKDESDSDHQYLESQLAENDQEFINALSNELNEKIENTISENVDKRFGVINLCRMYFQWAVISDVKRAKKAERALCKGLSPKDLTKEINAKIDHYNETTGADLSYIKDLDDIPELSIVTTDVAVKILEREAMEVTDAAIGFLLDIFICIIIASIIGYVSGCYLPAAILNIVSVIVGIIILLLYGGPIMNQLEIVIKQLLIYNFQQYMGSQNIISQIIS